MKENRYDDEVFFNRYGEMKRSMEGLEGAGEWHVLKGMLPDLAGSRVLDLGCGFGWHCAYAAEHGASKVLGVDISEKMIAVARERNNYQAVSYQCLAIEDYGYPADSFDVVLSSLAFHYLESFEDISSKVYRTLFPGGVFVFSVEHPVFTAEGSQQWVEDGCGGKLCWPVDNYFREGRRSPHFLGVEVAKYHKTLTTYLNGLLRQGFMITGVEEPQPDPSMLDEVPEMRDELRRPMMLIVSAVKPI